MTIAPSGNLQYSAGDTVVLNCSFYPAQEIGQHPFWTFVHHDEESGNETVEFVDVSRQNYHYDKSNCIWKNTLTIHNFSDKLAGTYSCGYSYHIVNQTLRVLKDGR